MRKLKVGREKREESKNNNGAVIAVDTNHIGHSAHINAIAKPYSTKGRLIYDINDTSEFEKDPFNIKINYKPNISLVPYILTKTILEFDGDWIDHRYFIIHKSCVLLVQARLTHQKRHSKVPHFRN